MTENFPNSSDRLFKEQTSISTGARLQNPSSKFFLYSEGYKEAGNILYDLCLDNPLYLNTLIYPMVFNYRHFLELRLKELTIMGYKYLGENKDFTNEHILIKLWITYRNEILKKIDKINKASLDNVERLIKEFDSEDHKSMCYRYPVFKGTPRLKSITRETLDVVNFKIVMEKLIYFFDLQWEMITRYQDIQEDLLRDMYNNYETDMYNDYLRDMSKEY